MVGQPKSGTTALYEMLRAHPEIFMPALKEPNFFCTDLVGPAMWREGFSCVTAMDDYLALFDAARPGQIAGEASVHYLASHVAARKICDFNSNAHIIAILREPASLLRSLHLQLLESGVESVPDLATALGLEGERRRGRAVPSRSHRPQLLMYSENVRYVDQLERFRTFFPPEQMLVLVYDDFVRDNEAVLRQVFRFLGIDDSVSVPIIHANPSVLVRAPRVGLALHRLSTGPSRPHRIVRNAIKAVTGRTVRRQLLAMAYTSLATKPPAVDSSLMADLRERYAPEVARLSEYLGRDLVAQWG